MVKQKGFTLVELMIVVAIIGVLAAIAYPSYQNHVRSTKRADMMTELTRLAGSIESAKLAKGSYTKLQASNYQGSFPTSGTALYDVTATINRQGWKLTATPKATGMMAQDGTLTYDSKGIKCRGTNKCGSGSEWKD